MCTRDEVYSVGRGNENTISIVHVPVRRIRVNRACVPRNNVYD